VPVGGEKATLTTFPQIRHLFMSAPCPYIVRCNDCEFVSDVYLDEQRAMDERDFHSFEKLHAVSIWRYEGERWTLVTELLGVVLR
jgi:hypothetical protein